MTKHIVIIDIVRTMCVIWIVGVWHMVDYFPGHDLLNYNYVTIGVLGIFTFLSGLFLGKKKMSPIEFYKSRLFRFFPLLLVSAFGLFIMGIINGWAVLGTISGLSGIIFPWATTLWYFSMMILFYVITPFLTIMGRKKVLLWDIMLLGILILIYIKIGNSDLGRIILYFPFYLLGVRCPIRVVEFLQKKLINVSMLIIGISLLTLFAEKNLPLSVMAVILILFGFAGFMDVLCNYRIKKIFIMLSYASMCAYLFHRHLYGIVNKVAKMTMGEMPLWAIPLLLVSVFVLAYYIQKGYDKLLLHYRLG